MLNDMQKAALLEFANAYASRIAAIRMSERNGWIDRKSADAKKNLAKTRFLCRIETIINTVPASAPEKVAP